MNTEEIKEIVNQYFDNELSKGEEVILFTQLSQDQEAREYFKEMHSLKNVVDSSFEEYPEKLDEKIFKSISTSKDKRMFFRDRSKIFEGLSYAFAIILLVISIFFYNESVKYQEKIDITYQQLNYQNKMIQVLFNTLPETEVNAEFANDIIVTPKM